MVKNKVRNFFSKIKEKNIRIPINLKILKYIGKKIFFAVIAYFIAITLVFFIYRLMAGNPANLFALDPRVDPDVRENLLERWGLTEPLWKQYFIFLRNLFQGDLGYSFLHKRPVGVLIAEALPWTLLLLGTSFVLNALIGIVMGAYVAWRRGSAIDTAFVLTYNIYNAIPLFFTGMLFIGIFGFQARINNWPFYFPTYGAIDPRVVGQAWWVVVLNVLWHLFLPLLVLTVYGILSWGWFMRGNLINTLSEDYVKTARAKGLNNNQILYGHCFKNSLLPVITNIGMSIGGIIGGSVLIETVFSYPGTGLLLYEALLKHDYPLIQGSFIIISGLTLLGLAIAEILYGIIDPRIGN